MAGCITEKKCNEKYPAKTSTITEIIDTTIITSTKSFDTIISMLNRDTIFIVDKITDVKLEIIRMPGDSIFIKPECPSDTIRIEKIRIETNSERIQNVLKSNLKSIGISLFLIALILFGFGYAINSLKK